MLGTHCYEVELLLRISLTEIVCCVLSTTTV
jgi:hypothetical protein